MLVKQSKKEKNFAKSRENEIGIFKVQYANNADKLQYAIENLNKLQVAELNLHEIENDIL